MGMFKRYGFSIEDGQPPLSLKRGVEKGKKGLKSLKRNLKLAVVIPEDLKFSKKRIFDPQDKFLQVWNRMFVVCCFLSVFLDPLIFYAPYIDDDGNCLDMEKRIAMPVAIVRTLLDAFYAIRITFQFRTAFVAPSSRVFGRGELVIDPEQIANRYLKRGRFIIDILSILPLPQIALIQFFIRSKGVRETKVALLIIVLIQFIPRLLRILPLASELKKTVGVFVESDFFGAISYLMLFMLSSHIVGSFWYLLAVQRNIDCWEKACKDAPEKCEVEYLYCSTNTTQHPFPESWTSISETFLNNACSVKNDDSTTKGVVKFGIYKQAMLSGIFSRQKFFSKYIYCLWWGLQNLSTLGQGLQTSMSTGEIGFSISIAVFGLVFFALLIGNMQTYLQSVSLRVEEMRLKRRDSEQWMHHRQLPQELRERVRRYDQYRWVETRGVDEQALVQSLPKDLRRDIKRHLCLTYVRRVPLFAKMDERLLDAICERLKPSLYTEQTYIMREGDPVDEILFMIRGRLESETTNGGRSGFFNRSLLTEGDFCGDELLTWSLDPKTGSSLPSSTRTVKTLTEVEAFALSSEDMKFVASQFRRLHTRQVQHTFRYYSQQWRTWGAIYIRSSWKRYLQRKAMKHLQNEDEAGTAEAEPEAKAEGVSGSSSFATTIYVSRFASNALRGVHRLRSARNEEELVPLSKPPEPDFNLIDLE